MSWPARLGKLAATLLVAACSVEAHLPPTLRFHGGAQEVGSASIEVQLGGARLLVDCGSDLEQEDDADEGKQERPSSHPLPPDPGGLVAVLLTHAHLDHLGRLPELVAAGFAGPVYSTPATAAVARLALFNVARFDPRPRRFFWSARAEAQRKGLILHWRDCPGSRALGERHHQHAPLSVVQNRLRQLGLANAYPCRSCAEADRDELLRRFRTPAAGEPFRPAPGVHAVFHPTHHLPGSAAVHLKDLSSGVTVLLSGDGGNDIELLYPSPPTLPTADWVVVEGTYGATVRPRPYRPQLERFWQEVGAALRNGQLVWIPALVLDRTQKVLAVLKEGMREGRLPQIPVFVPSPTARAACRLWEELAAGRHGSRDFLPTLAGRALFPPYQEELPPAHQLRGPAVLITASGMMHVGLSASLLPDLLPRGDVFVAIVSFQHPATPGGRLLAGHDPLRWGGSSIPVRATWRKYDLFSGHADREDLRRLLAANRASRILLNHGEKRALDALSAALREAGFAHVEVAQADRQYRLVPTP